MKDKRNKEMIGYDNRMFFPVSLLNVFNIGLSKGGDNPDEAWSIYKWLMIDSIDITCFIYGQTVRFEVYLD